MTLHTNELDFASGQYKPVEINNTAELLAYFDKTFEQGKKDLANAKEEQMADMWTLRNGDHIINVRPKEDVIRMSYNQTVHHRAQMGVFLRLLNVPIPGSYGPSADEMNF